LSNLLLAKNYNNAFEFVKVTQNIANFSGHLKMALSMMSQLHQQNNTAFCWIYYSIYVKNCSVYRNTV